MLIKMNQHMIHTRGANLAFFVNHIYDLSSKAFKPFDQ